MSQHAAGKDAANRRPAEWGAAPRWAGWHANLPQLRITAAAAVATALAALTLSPVFIGKTWVRPSLFAIAIVAVIGAAGRAYALPRLLTLVAQVAGLTLFVTGRFAGADATAGFVPSFASIQGLFDVARTGATSVNEQTVPVVDTTGIVLFVVVGVGLAALEVDFAAVACRCPAIAGVVLAAMYGVGVAVLPGGASWVWFAIAATGWLVLLYVARRESEHAWGGVLGATGGWFSGRSANPRAVLGQRIGVGAVLAGIAVAAVIPGLGDGVVGRFGGGGGGSGGGSGSGSGGNAVKLDLTATIQRNLLSKTNTPLFSYHTSDGSPQYLRLTVLDRFEGVAWKPARLPADAPLVALGPQAIPGVDAPPGKRSVLVTNMHALGATEGLTYIPAPYTPVNVNGLSYEWRWDTSTSTLFSRSTELGEARFQVQSEYVEPDPRTMAQQTTATEAPLVDLGTPSGVPPSIKSTALAVTAGATTDYAKAVRLQNWFRSLFKYDTEAPPTDTANAINAFLNTRVGYCQQFAATYALMGRSLGLATRVVVGFAPGKANVDSSYTVGTHDYHAWPEVWFDHLGWVRFEPTPRTGAGSNVDVPIYTVPNALAPPVAPSASASATPGATAGATTRPTGQPAAEGAAAAQSSKSWTERARPALVVLLVMLLVVLALAPGLARAARRRRRLGLPPGGRAVEAAWDELADTARDLGVPWADEDTPRRTADALVRDASLTGGAAVAVQELRRDLERTRYAGASPTIATSPEPAVREVREQLLAVTSRRDRLRARFLPRSVIGRDRRAEQK